MAAMGAAAAAALFQSTLPARGATQGGFSVRTRPCHFNPRSPHGERLATASAPPTAFDFNPRSPHGERPCTATIATFSAYFNPRSPHGERRVLLGAVRLRGISIHAPRTGSDGKSHFFCDFCKISIHAPRTGSDHCRLCRCTPTTNFNPRSPHGERLRHARRYVRCTISIHAPRTGSDAPPDSHIR